MQMGRLKQQDNIMRFITLITFIFLISCNHQMDKNNKHIKITEKKEVTGRY